MVEFSADVIRLNPGLSKSGIAASNPSKYHNAKTEAAGMMFDSGKEAAGVSGLILLEQQKNIFALRLQVRFPLPGSTTYIADAVYCELSDKGVLELRIVDFKGFKTKEYIIKKRLFREKYGLEIEER